MNDENEIKTGMGLLDSAPQPPDTTVESPEPTPAPPEPDPVIPNQEPPPPEPEPAPAPPQERRTQTIAGHQYFKKTQVNMGFFVNKKRVEFEVIGQNVGVIKLSPDKDEEIIAGLLAAAHAHKGGVVVIDADMYDDLKKNQPFVPSVPKSQPSIRLWRNEPPKLPKLDLGGNAATEAIRISAPAKPAPAAPAVASVADGTGKTPAATFTPNMQKKSGPVLRPPASGKFREGVLPPPIKAP